VVTKGNACTRAGDPRQGFPNQVVFVHIQRSLIRCSLGIGIMPAESGLGDVCFEDGRFERSAGPPGRSPTISAPTASNNRHLESARRDVCPTLPTCGSPRRPERSDRVKDVPDPPPAPQRRLRIESHQRPRRSLKPAWLRIRPPSPEASGLRPSDERRHDPKQSDHCKIKPPNTTRGQRCAVRRSEHSGQ